MPRVDCPIFTIGFTRTTAERFFSRLAGLKVKKVIDVRLRNTSQLAGFAKAGDLAYFLEKLGGIQYSHEPMLAPTPTILHDLKIKKGGWDRYQEQFLTLMSDRKVEDRLTPEALEGTCLLCSEATAHHCHRRLVCEYLNEKWGQRLSVTHL